MGLEMAPNNFEFDFEQSFKIHSNSQMERFFREIQIKIISMKETF